MIRSEVKTGMCFLNNTYQSRNILLYILESNSEYIECWKIDRGDKISDKVFRTGSEWDKTMYNYHLIDKDKFIEELFDGPME